MDKLVQRIGRELDMVVAGIFDAMMDMPCAAVAMEPVGSDELCASVAFEGALRGWCRVWMGRDEAEAYVYALLGPAAALGERDREDSVSELCNMVAGGWKSLQPPPPGCAAMSPPSVCVDASKGEAEEMLIRRCYVFGQNGFAVELALYAGQESMLFAAG